MKHRLPILIITALIAFTSCKKETKKYPVVGTWQELKLRTYTQSYSGIIAGDTTYVGPALSHNDYAQFDNDGSCNISSDYQYYPTNVGGNQQVAVGIVNYNYKAVGSNYVLTYPTATLFPSGFITTDTVSVNSNNGLMLIHSTFDNHQFYIISDAYYVKEGIEPL